MLLDPRTKLLILSITSISVFLNESIVIECLFTAIPVFLLLQAKEFRTASKYVILFIVLLTVQLLVILKLPVTLGGIIYMFDVYIRKLIPCFMLGTFLIRTTRVSAFWLHSVDCSCPKALQLRFPLHCDIFRQWLRNGIILKMPWFSEDSLRLLQDFCDSRSR